MTPVRVTIFGERTTLPLGVARLSGIRTDGWCRRWTFVMHDGTWVNIDEQSKNTINVSRIIAALEKRMSTG